MITGINRVYQHEGKQYHIQGEDLGIEHGCFEVRVYDGGTVLWRKRISYNDILDRSLSKGEQEETLRLLLEKTLTTVQVGIAKGKLT